MKKEQTQTEPKFQELRNELRKTIYTELQKLPELFQSLEPKERIDLLIKIMPFAIAKCENMSATAYEGENPFENVFGYG